nr:radical SAM protein [Sphingomonas psychrotolerans]
MDLSNSGPKGFSTNQPVEQTDRSQSEQIFGLLMNDLLDGADHPEIWEAFPQFIQQLPHLSSVMRDNAGLLQSPRVDVRLAFTILVAMGSAAQGDPAGALAFLEDSATRYTESPLVQGAVFHIQSLLDPGNPKFDLKSKFCMRPFHELDVLEGSTHLCCANWLNLSTGDMAQAEKWQDIWNSPTAERIRASIHDGSFRHCNKVSCPAIQANKLPGHTEVAAMSPKWRMVVEQKETHLPHGPERVNLAYDKTCNLSCPSCRTEKIAADSATRARFDQLQERSILPMLKEAKIVFITGSGDPFASKNFRNLMERLDADAYPDLRFIIMTNAMLFNRREWDRFPALHGRVLSLQISIDAAAGPTHELLRRGARWEVMQENLQFAADLLHAGKVEQIHLSFTVQTENYSEMGDAVDLADRLGVTGLYFGKITNWGTFTDQQYRAKAVFQPAHPLHHDFVKSMRDPRLRTSRVNIGNLIDFIPVAA